MSKAFLIGAGATKAQYPDAPLNNDFFKLMKRSRIPEVIDLIMVLQETIEPLLDTPLKDSTIEEVMEKSELARLAVGLPKDIKEFRIVKIGDIDAQVDGGTHVNHLSEIGMIEVIKTVNKGKNNRRMYFVLK